MSNNTSEKYSLLRKDGIACKTDIGLYYAGGYSSLTLLLASIYGAAQQVKALFSLFSMGHGLNYVFPQSGNSILLNRERGYILRFKGASIGYGKQHGLIWSEHPESTEIIYWFSPEEKEAALCSVLSKRRIPYAKQWLPLIEKLLIESENLITLKGWGGIQGYLCDFYHGSDDHICDLICEELKKNK